MDLTSLGTSYLSRLAMEVVTCGGFTLNCMLLSVRISSG